MGKPGSGIKIEVPGEDESYLKHPKHIEELFKTLDWMRIRKVDFCWVNESPEGLIETRALEDNRDNRNIRSNDN